MHGRPEFFMHVVAVAVTQTSEVDAPLALDGIGTVAMCTSAVEYLLAGVDGLGIGRLGVALGLRSDRICDQRHAASGSRRGPRRLDGTQANGLTAWHTVLHRAIGKRALKLRQDSVDPIAQLRRALCEPDGSVP